MNTDPVSHWHKWFAWYPVDVSENNRCWLKPVWRIASKASYDGYGGYIWKYFPFEKDPKVEEVKKYLSNSNGYEYDFGHYGYDESRSTAVLKIAIFVLIPAILYTTVLAFLLR